MKLLFPVLSILFAIVPFSAYKNKISEADQDLTYQIMFTSKRDGNFEVYIMNEDGTNIKNLTNNSSVDYGLNWSPDGNYILFYSNRNGNEDVWRMDNDGTNLTNLSNLPSNERAAAYSPDGKKIVFISNMDDNTLDLYTMSAEGGNIQKVTQNRTYCESPEWTNDGKYIVFTLEVEKDSTEKNFSGELFVINADGNNPRRLTHREGFDSGADISPNGKKIAFYGKSETGNMDIFIMNIDGTEILNLTNDAPEDYSPSWSRDGNWISFTSGNSGNYDIWKMNIITKEKIQLTQHPKRDETPFYKP